MVRVFMVTVADVPELIVQWDFEKNTLLPTEVTTGSHKKVWWKCKLGHSWEARIDSRI